MQTRYSVGEATVSANHAKGAATKVAVADTSKYACFEYFAQ